MRHRTVCGVLLTGMFGSGPVLAAGTFSWVDEDGALRLLWGDRPVLQYNYETVPAPEGVDPVFARGAYIHPIWNPAGQVVTDDFATDHRHHRGLFFAYSKTNAGDLAPNFWEFQEGTGRIVFDSMEEPTNTADAGTLGVRHVWEARRGDDWVPVVRERWVVQAYAPRSADQDFWEFDLTSEQECASDTPVEIVQLRYGGLGFRGHADWGQNPDEVVVLTSEGDDRGSANATRPRWCYMGGPLNGGYGGITLMDHPDNIRFPTPVRVHPTMPFFCYMLAQKEPYTIQPGQTLVQRYRVLVHASQPDAALLDSLYLRGAPEQ